MKKPSKYQISVLADAIYHYGGRLSGTEYQADTLSVIKESTLLALKEGGFIEFLIGGPVGSHGCFIFKVTEAGLAVAKAEVDRRNAVDAARMEAQRKEHEVRYVIEMTGCTAERAKEELEKLGWKEDAFEEAAKAIGLLPPKPAPTYVKAPPPRRGLADHLLDAAKLLGVERDPWESLGERVVEALAGLEELRLDALRWRKLVGCDRIRILGSAKAGKPDGHMDLELWGKYPGNCSPNGPTRLTELVDGFEAPREPRASSLELRASSASSSAEPARSSELETRGSS